MGYWCTLHLFDDQKFYKEVVPELKGQKGDLTSTYKEFLAFHRIGGTATLSQSELDSLVQEQLTAIFKITNVLSKDFKSHPKIQSVKDYDERINFLDNLKGHYEFCHFFEYYIFKRCADFFPHVALGKGGIDRNFKIDPKAISDSIIGEIDYWNEFFCPHGMGITNWLNHEEVELLYLDRDQLVYEDNPRAEGILQLLQIAHEFKLGLIVGVDMNESKLELLEGNKLVPAKLWKGIPQTGLLFER